MEPGETFACSTFRRLDRLDWDCHAAGAHVATTAATDALAMGKGSRDT
jgi:hypothetical protein